MIPKIIHWCWLSNDPIPENLQKCMDTWKIKLPDYEMIHWNFDRFPKGKSKWVDDAFVNKKYAFAADYIRLYALYNYGGIYLDMDVEVCKSFDPFLTLNSMLCWQKSLGGLEVAAFGVEPKAEWVKKCLDEYESISFVKADGSFDLMTLPERVERNLLRNGYKLLEVPSIEAAKKITSNLEIPVFPCDYFSPKSYVDGKIEITTNTYSIHHFAGSWLPWYSKFEKKFWNFLGLKNHGFISRSLKLFGK